LKEDSYSIARKNGITVIAYSPLATGLENIRSADPEGILRRVAEASCKSEVQVALNWCISKENVIAIPKASTAAHVIENMGASGWKLQPEHARCLKIEFDVAVVGLSRAPHGGQSAGACK